MSDHQPGGVPDVDEVRRLLREEARQHRPDVDLIMQRVDRARREQRRPLTRTGPFVVAGAAAALIVAVVTVGRPWGTGAAVPAGGVGGIPASSGSLPSDGAGPTSAGAISGGVISGGTTTITRSSSQPVVGDPTSTVVTDGGRSASETSGGPHPPVGTTAPLAAGNGPNATASGTVASGAAASGTVASGPAASGTTTHGTAASGTTASAMTDSAVPAAPVVSVSGLAAGTAVGLPRGGDRDWVVVGARKDGVAVRAKAGTGEIAAVAPQGASAAVASGPLRVSWSGGAPEQTHAGASTWWALPSTTGSGAGFRVEVRPVRPGRIDLYVGSTGAPLGLTVTRTTTGGRRVTTSVAVPAGPAAVVTVDLPDVTAGEIVEVRIPGDGPGAGASIAAVAVR